MIWPGSIYLLILFCCLLWMLGKLRRLSRLKARLRRPTVLPTAPPRRSTRQCRREYRDADN
ncbi:hypothetical protein EGK14_19170 [Erwinia sp. 198]|nr:hypothetical protein EGK14_19170 [Erwinia sp. 198]